MADDLGVVAGVSDRGRVRESNADAMAFGFTGDVAQPEYVAAVVCDGVGSGAKAGQAAQDAADAGAAELLGCLADGLDARKASTMAMAAAGDAVNALADPRLAEEDTPATTYVSAVVTAAEVTVAWLGDSRAYWVAPGARADAPGAHGAPGEGVTCLTIDHTVRNTYLADGMRAAHTLTRWLGADSDGTDPQVSTVRPDRAGVLVLCTDGLWGYLDDPGTLAAEVLTHASAADAASGLVRHALSEGGRDNVAVIAVPFPAGRRWP
nr:protein phosphatase 2C domain-containing protein [Haloechinothrix aidingensis]